MGEKRKEHGIIDRSLGVDRGEAGNSTELKKKTEQEREATCGLH